MEKLTSIILILLLSLLSSPSWSVTFDDLVYRNGLIYKKFSDVPFTGKITGKEQGSFKDGMRNGEWVTYWDNGQLEMKGNFENGKREGFWSYFNQDKTINHIFTGTYKNDARVND